MSHPRSLQGPAGGSVKRIIDAALESVDAEQAVRKYFWREGAILHAGEAVYNLNEFRKVYIAGLGKAGAAMLKAAAHVLGDLLDCGVVVVKEGHMGEAGLLPHSVEVLEAGHPVPDERSVWAAGRLLGLVDRMTSDDLLVGLISGGGSALVTAPAEGIGLEDLQNLTDLLLASGAAIEEINILRKHLDQVKGGRLAGRLNGGTAVVLVLSDVIGDSLQAIASGPFAADSSTFQDALKVFEKYHLLDKVAPSIQSILEKGMQGEIADTPKGHEVIFDRIRHIIVGSNRLAVQAALKQAEREGYNGFLLTAELKGEARQAGQSIAAVARQIHSGAGPVQRPACVVAGGETTVTIHGKGKGGRNQELALGAVEGLAGLDGVLLATLATDGGDGPTDAAGALVSGKTWEHAVQAGLDPHSYLHENDSYSFFQALDDLIITGPTLTNANDLVIMVVE